VSGWLLDTNALVCLWFLSETTTPAPYCLAARTVNEIYPQPHRETPPEVDALVRAFARARGMRRVGDDPG